MLSEYYETDGGTAVSFSLSQELRSPPWQLAEGRKNFLQQGCLTVLPGRCLCLAAVYCNRVRTGRTGQNGDAGSRVLVSGRAAPDDVSALLSWKVSQSSRVIVHFISPQLLAPITSSTWVSLHAASHQLCFLGTGISCHYL